MNVMRYSVNVLWSEDDNAYVAISPEFPGLSGVGDDAVSAMDELRAAQTAAIEAMIEDGKTVPPVSLAAEYSGQFRLRVGHSLHAQLVQRAAADGVSLNSCVVSLIAIGVGNKQACDRLVTASLDTIQALKISTTYPFAQASSGAFTASTVSSSTVSIGSDRQSVNSWAN